jgi:hypothetical protein
MVILPKCGADLPKCAALLPEYGEKIGEKRGKFAVRGLTR